MIASNHLHKKGILKLSPMIDSDFMIISLLYAVVCLNGNSLTFNERYYFHTNFTASIYAEEKCLPTEICQSNHHEF